MKLKNTLSELKRRITKRIDAKRAAPKEEKQYISPNREMEGALGMAGIFLRGFVAFVGVFGLQLFLFDAIGTYAPNAPSSTATIPLFAIILFSVIFASLSALASFNRITRAAVPLGAALLLVLIATIGYGNPIGFFADTLRRLYNDTVYGISISGYASFSSAMVNDAYSHSISALTVWSSVLLSAVLSLIMYFAVVKKARVWLVTLVISAFAAPILAMNLSRSNTGAAFVVAFIVGFLVVRAYENRYVGRYDKAQRRKKAKRVRGAKLRQVRSATKLERLKIRSAADKVFEAAIDAEMGRSRARAAKKAVLHRCRTALKAKNKEAKKEINRVYKEKKKEISKNIYSDVTLSKSEQKLLAADKKRRNRAAGGFAGAGAVALALLAVLPGTAASSPFRIIDSINNVVSEIRRDLTDFIMGDDVNLEAPSEYLYGTHENFGYEKLTFEPREYENLLIFKAESGRKHPIYLKSRSAIDFNLSKDSWSYANSLFVMEYNEKFGKGFSPTTITQEIYSYLYPSSSDVPASDSGVDLSQYGFRVQKITLSRINGDSKLFFTPTVFNVALGALEKGGETKSPHRVTPYFDGVFTSTAFEAEEEGYSAVAYVHNMKDRELGEIFEDELELITLVYSLGERLRLGESGEALLSEYNTAMSRMTISSDLGERYLLKMSDSERDRFDAVVEKELEYREWAEKTYTTPLNNSRIKDLAEDLLEDAQDKKGELLSDYEKVMLVKDYLSSEEFTYTLTPTSEKKVGSTVTETFLISDKEGYCSHFATAATLLLREMGVTVRYCEGYLANEWYVNYGTQVTQRYRSDVTDSDSHTWIEVYHDGVGWINYEVTKPYIEDMYNAPEEKEPEQMTQEDLIEEQQQIPDNRPGYDEEIDIVLPDDMELGPEARRAEMMALLRRVVIVVVIAAVLYIAVAAFVRHINKKAKAEIDRRYALAADARNEDVYRDKSVDKRALAKAIIKSLFEVLDAGGIGPKKGEQLSEYAVRIEKENPGISVQNHRDVMELVTREMYGHGLIFGEMCILADYYSDVMVSVYTGLPLSKKIKYRYFKRII